MKVDKELSLAKMVLPYSKDLSNILWRKNIAAAITFCMII
jgi:hypothetical protein